MPVETSEREIGRLLSEISQGEIRLPEIQRGYVWKPTQVAKLIDSLYRSYPTGSLLFWKTTETLLDRDFALDGTPPSPAIQPLYLLDGQQRLTALSRALGDDHATVVVFNLESETFQNQSAATANDPRPCPRTGPAWWRNWKTRLITGPRRAGTTLTRPS